MKVVLNQGQKEAMRLEADQDDIEKFVYRQDGEHLYLSSAERSNWADQQKMVIYVTVKNLDELSFEGVGRLECSSQLIIPSLKVRVEGVGSVSLWLKCKTLDASMEGMGKLKLKGSANTAKLSMEGAGKLDAFGLQAANVNVKLEGVGKAEVHCTDKLEAYNDGIGKILYQGNPRTVKKTNSGLGSIQEVKE